MSERPSGTWGTVLVPWDDDDRIDERRLHAQLDVLTTAGLAGIYAHGTAGEFHELDEDEWELVTEILVGRCRDAGVGVQIGAGHMSARLSARRVARTVRYRPDAIQVILPDWLPLTTRDAVTAVDRLANAAGGIPIVLYNPPHAKTVLGPEALDQLSSAVPSLVAVKVGGGNAEWYAAMRPAMRRLAVFVPGHTLATGHRLGAAGSFSNVACLSPVGSVAWQSMMDTDPPGAADLERRIQNFLETYVMPFAAAGHPNPALDKTLAYIGDWSEVGTRIRGPWRSVPAEEAERLRPIARATLPELFAPA